jgi:putative ABC transport system permease protein
MSLWKIAWRSIQQRTLVSSLTILSMGLGVALVVSVLVTYGVVEQSFHRGGEGYDLIIGAKGGKEQLVLNTVFYLSQPIGNIPYSLYEELVQGKYAGHVETAVPVCMGHSYQGFRVIGTIPEMFDLKYHGDKSYAIAPGGRNFNADSHFEAVMGSAAAAQTKLQVGDKFQAVHGSSEGGRVHKETFKIVGLLEPTGTPVDRGIFVNMNGFFDIHGAEENAAKQPKKTADPKSEKQETAEKGSEAPQEAKAEDEEHHGEEAKEGEEHHEHEHAEGERQITAVLVCIRPTPPGRADIVAKTINMGKEAQAVVPTRVIAELFDSIVGKVEWVLVGMAVLTVIVAGISIMVSIYNSMNDRRHEIAIMRALGARRMTVMVIILAESIMLSLIGGAFGLLLGHGTIGACSSLIVKWTGVSVGLMQFQPMELVLIPGLILLASAVGYLPALSAYRTDVARALTNTP